MALAAEWFFAIGQNGTTSGASGSRVPFHSQPSD